MKKPRARDLGIPFGGIAGTNNAITDVKDVWVGHTTLIRGEGPLVVGQGPVRTGVTAIRPRGESNDPVFGAWNSLNGCGEMTGSHWLEESGLLVGPVTLTTTLSVGIVHDAVTQWLYTRHKFGWGLHVVSETYDGFLNDTWGCHIQSEHVWSALDSATSGPVTEGNVGGGTGTICYDFKGGIGTASRNLDEKQGGYTVGVLVQSNHGSRHQLTMAGVPVGKEITDLMPEKPTEPKPSKSSSIIVVVATNCPLLPHQLKRLCRRVPLGIARTGGIGENYSGDIFLAFSTTPLGQPDTGGIRQVSMLNNDRMDSLFEAVVQATEEAILNSLIAAESMTGINNRLVHRLPHDRLREVMNKYHI